MGHPQLHCAICFSASSHSQRRVSSLYLISIYPLSVHLYHPKPKEILPVLFYMYPLVHPGFQMQVNSVCPITTILPWASDFPEFLILFYLQGCCTAFPQRNFLNSSKSNCLALLCPSRASLVSQKSVSRFFWGEV